VLGQELRRPRWTPDQFTTAIGTFEVKFRFCAGGTEGALKCADKGLIGTRREVDIAALTTGPEF
jgi:hypothetical protein